jgi:hypothetical protein
MTMLANFIDVCKIPILFVRRDENSARGRASPSHGGGHWFESSTAHQETASGLFFLYLEKRFQPEKTIKTKGYKKNSASRKRSRQRKKVHEKGACVFLYDGKKSVFTPDFLHRMGENFWRSYDRQLFKD